MITLTVLNLNNNIDDINYFGVPKYFFRANWTTGTQSQIMAYVDWISSFELLKQTGYTFLGNIPLSQWNSRTDTKSNLINSFIETSQLRPSRFALAYIPPTSLSVYVDIAFIALDNENLHENNEDHYDFGDKKFPYYKGNVNRRLEELLEGDDSDEEEIEYVTNVDVDRLYEYIPKNVLRFLTTTTNTL